MELSEPAPEPEPMMLTSAVLSLRTRVASSIFWLAWCASNRQFLDHPAGRTNSRACRLRSDGDCQHVDRDGGPAHRNGAWGSYPPVSGFGQTRNRYLFLDHDDFIDCELGDPFSRGVAYRQLVRGSACRRGASCVGSAAAIGCMQRRVGQSFAQAAGLGPHIPGGNAWRGRGASRYADL